MDFWEYDKLNTKIILKQEVYLIQLISTQNQLQQEIILLLVKMMVMLFLQDV